MTFPGPHDQDEPFDPLGARLRALPDPPVPARLEARLLANLNVQVTRPRFPRPWARWAVAAAALIAAGFITLTVWPRSRTQMPEALRQKASESTPPTSALALAQRSPGSPEAADVPAFRWPVQEQSPLTASIATVSRVLDR
jgi:hypothetical protein